MKCIGHSAPRVVCGVAVIAAAVGCLCLQAALDPRQHVLRVGEQEQSGIHFWLAPSHLLVTRDSGRGTEWVIFNRATGVLRKPDALNARWTRTWPKQVSVSPAGDWVLWQDDDYKKRSGWLRHKVHAAAVLDAHGPSVGLPLDSFHHWLDRPGLWGEFAMDEEGKFVRVALRSTSSGASVAVHGLPGPRRLDYRSAYCTRAGLAVVTYDATVGDGVRRKLGPGPTGGSAQLNIVGPPDYSAALASWSVPVPPGWRFMWAIPSRQGDQLAVLAAKVPELPESPFRIVYGGNRADAPTRMRVVVGRRRGGSPHEVYNCSGALAAGPRHPAWLPDGRALSFVQRGDVWTVGVPQ